MADLFERGPEIDALFEQALERPAAERSGFLQQACGDDFELREALTRLLAASDAEQRDPLLEPGGALRGSLFRDVASRLANDAAPIVPGVELGPYEVVALLGEGGMGQVFRATDRRLHRDVALKVIDERVRSPAQVERFAREARAASALNHPNIVTIYDVGRDGPLFYIAMELVEGKTLRARITARPLGAHELLDLSVQLADGLGAAHARGVVHRDLKPSNVIVTDEGIAKILDFGLAKQEPPRPGPEAPTSTLQERLTGEGMIFGTIGYMSPEQASGKEVDFRTDLFSFGSILYELAAGVATFKRASAAETLAAILTEEPAPLARLNPALPAALLAAVDRCLAKDPRQRFASTDELAAELRRARDGGSAVRACPACGRDTDVRHQFCSQCGSELARAEPAPPSLETAGRASMGSLSDDGERRHATLLIARPRGYEALVERLPAGDVEALMVRIRSCAAAALVRFGGVLNRFDHEEVVGLFGVPTAREDEAAQAVRAALELRQQVLALTRVDPRLGDLGCSISASVHSGRVVVLGSGGRDDKYRISGDVVVAARGLCDAAEPGEILISPEARRLCLASVQAEAKRPIRLRGAPDPTTPYRVVAAEERSAPPLESDELALTPFTGRDAELATLLQHLDAAADGRGSFVRVLGDAGTGKSRLLHELSRRLDRARFTALEARCQAYGQSAAYMPLIQICRDVLGLVEGASSKAHEGRVVEGIRGLDPELEPLLPVYLHLLGLTMGAHPLPPQLSGNDLRYAMQEALVALFTVTARRRPVLMVLEDCHWIDDASRSAITQLAELCSDIPLLLVVSLRAETDAGWGQEARPASVRLDPLGADSSVAMIQGALGAERVPPQLASLIHERSGGNPFFVEELCRTLVNEGYLRRADGEVELTRQLSELQLPDTVQAVIRSRIDRADSGPREVLRQASVIGREFSHDVLERVADADHGLRASLAALKRLGLIRQTAVLPHAVYRFQHALTQEVAYDSLLRHQRSALHGRVARALERAFGDRLDEHCDRLAAHFAEAEDWDKAVEYGARAAHRALALAQFADALSGFERVRGWIGRLADPGRRDEQTVQLLFEEDKVCELLGERSKQHEVIARLLALLEAGDERGVLVDARVRQADLLALERRFEEAEAVVEEALALSRRLGDTVRQRDALQSRAFLRWQWRRDEEALQTFEELIALDRVSDDSGRLALHLLNRATVLRGLERCTQAIPDVREALRLLERGDNRTFVIEGYYVAYLVYRGAGEPQKADLYLRKTITHIDPRHDAVVLPWPLAAMANRLVERGETEEAVEFLERALEQSRSSRYAFGLSHIEQSLGDMLLGLGRNSEALSHLEAAAATFRRMGDVAGELRASARAAPILERGSPERARATWQRVHELALTRDVTLAIEAKCSLARLDQARGDAARAVRWIEDALELTPQHPATARRGDLLNDLGIALWKLGRLEDALARYREALAVFETLEDATHEGLILNSIAATLKDLRRLDEATATLGRALAAHGRSGQTLLKGHALALLGDIHLQRDEPGAAARLYRESLELRRELGDRLGEGWMHHHLARAHLVADDRARAVEEAAAATRIAAECDDSRLAEACSGLGIE